MSSQVSGKNGSASCGRMNLVLHHCSIFHIKIAARYKTDIGQSVELGKTLCIEKFPSFWSYGSETGAIRLITTWVRRESTQDTNSSLQERSSFFIRSSTPK